MSLKTPVNELNNRMARLRQKMEQTDPHWEMIVIFSKINQYYFTGTMQDGMLLIPRAGEAVFWVRRSYERAREESLFEDIRPMSSFKEAASGYSTFPNTIYMETEVVTLAVSQRFQKYFPYSQVKSVDRIIASVRAVKSSYELAFMIQSGELHRRAMEECVPKLLREGMSEADLAVELYAWMVKEGHHGIARFSMFDTEMITGHVCFGESSICPTSYDGPGGQRGLSTAVPLIGSRERKLKKGDLVYIDVGCGVNGYHTDKTMTYMFGKALPDEAIMAHQQCVEILHQAAAMLVPGEIPSRIYQTILESVEPSFLQNFMGYGNRQVKFLGHGIGLYVDEAPVIAKGFDDPIEEGMVFAIEPKKGVEGVGMVGIENTYLVTQEGGKCITGEHTGLMLV